MGLDINDDAKYTLVLAKVGLSYLNFWPQTTGWWVKPLRYLILVNSFCIGLANLSFMIIYITDVGVMASACAAVSTSIQTISKLLFLDYYSKDLSRILNVIETKYWPADLVDAKTIKSIRFGSRTIVLMMATYLASAYFSCWYFMALPLLRRQKVMPLESTFPFEWKYPPVYELLYVWQFISACYIIVNTICTHDYFFNALINNQVAQYKLLKGVLQTIGSREGENIYRRLKNIRENISDSSDPHDEEIAYGLTVECVKHHITVNRICDKLERIYSKMMFSQFCLSCTALCLSAFVFSKFPMYFTKMLSFLTAHLMQFFFLSAIGSELIYQSGQVSVAAFECKWYEKPYVKVRRALLLLIRQAQRPKCITALGIAQLDFVSFISVLRLSFSVYTLLNSLDVN